VVDASQGIPGTVIQKVDSWLIGLIASAFYYLIGLLLVSLAIHLVLSR